MRSLPVYIIAARRTAIGRIGGLHKLRRVEDLAAPVVEAVLKDASVSAEQVDEIIVGNCTAGDNPARLIALASGLPVAAMATTIDQQCASGLEACNMAAAQVSMVLGPNGSGKSTAYSRTSAEHDGASFWIINPDLLTKALVEEEHLPLRDANLAAVQRLEVWLEATINVRRSLGVETVLSTDKYRRLVTLARQRGYAISLFYVVLKSPALNVQRVQARVREGGHDVPKEKIVERYWRSLEQMPWFLGQADTAWIYDNSGAELVLLAHKSEGTYRLHSETIPAVAKAVRSLT